MQALCRTTALCTHYVGTALRRSHQRCLHAEEQITKTPGGRPTSDPTPYTPTPHPTPYTLHPIPLHRVVEDKLHPSAVRLAERVAAFVPAIVLGCPSTSIGDRWSTPGRTRTIGHMICPGSHGGSRPSFRKVGLATHFEAGGGDPPRGGVCRLTPERGVGRTHP